MSIKIDLISCYTAGFDRVPALAAVGNFIPLSQVRDDVGATYMREVEWQTDEKLIPYKKMCAQRKVWGQEVLKMSRS